MRTWICSAAVVTIIKFVATQRPLERITHEQSLPTRSVGQGQDGYSGENKHPPSPAFSRHSRKRSVSFVRVRRRYDQPGTRLFDATVVSTHAASPPRRPIGRLDRLA